MDAGRWEAPTAPGKWSPAQITEHLRLSYEVLCEELGGGRGLTLRTPAWLRPWLRWRYLRGILRTGSVPAGARAPREVRPGDGPFPQQPAIARLEAAALAFERGLEGRWAEPGTVLTHHLFGRLTATDAFRFVTVHAEHHLRQLAGEDDRPA